MPGLPRQRSRDRLGPDDVATRTRDLLNSLVARPLGQTSVSVYETARLVTLAPWLTGHRQRIRFLLDTQRDDGGWGGPDGYGLAPTLSATEALLTTLRRSSDGEPHRDDHGAVIAATGRGLRLLFYRLQPRQSLSIPDMPAVELIVTSLIESVNEHLATLTPAPITGLDAWRGTGRLVLPDTVDQSAVSAIRARLRTGHAVPTKLLHALEVAGVDAEAAASVRPTALGTVGASPAATAAWLGTQPPPPGDPSRRHLEQIVAITGGPVPCGLPITVFERSWVLSSLARNHIRIEPPAEIVDSLKASLTDDGAAGGSGLPPDADSTSVTLFALARLGHSHDPRCLRHFQLATHFCTWPGEQGTSTTVNAHVLEALAVTGASSTVSKVADWLRQQQDPDGSWSDRWHASPYYATAACVLALDKVGADQSTTALRRAVTWVMSSQRENGSWGRWNGTAEETSYALQVLLSATGRDYVRGHHALIRGLRYLRTCVDATDHPSLWHDKDLYAPTAIIRADVLGAIHRGETTLAARRIPPPATVTLG